LKDTRRQLTAAFDLIASIALAVDDYVITCTLHWTTSH